MVTTEGKIGRRADTVRVWKPSEVDKAYGYYPDELLHVSQRGGSSNGGLVEKVDRPKCPHCDSDNVRHSDRSETVCRECGHVGDGDPLYRDKIAAGRITNDD